MMMRTAGGPGTVSPLDFNERKRPMPRWMWMAIGVSALAHIGVGAWLYSQRFEVAAIPQDEGPITIIDMSPQLKEKPKPVPPSPTPPAPNTAVHETTAPTIPTDTITTVRSDTPATGPITTATIVEDPAPAVTVTTTPTPPADPVIRNPQWVRRPSADQMLAAYPDRAIRAEVSGRATLSCGVLANGSMTNCSVVSETPVGYGFGRAALGLSRSFRLSPRMVDGAIVEGARVLIPIAFTLPPGN
ncbi:MAG: energy transducer TonB [Pseudomonadota bacterium]